MAIVSLTNQTISSWTEGIYNVKETLKLAGWTVLSSSDGTTYDNSTDIITSASVLSNNNAWFWIQSPDGYAEYVFQRGNDDRRFTVVFSGNTVSGGFIGGTPNATTIPTATDQVFIRNPGTDFFQSSQATALPRWHVVADDAAPYTWWCGSWKSTTGTLSEQGGMIHDVLTSLTSGDPCGYLVHWSANNFTTANNINGTNVAPGAGGSSYYHLFCRNVTNTSWDVPEGQTIGGVGAGMYQNSIANPLTLKDELLPVIYTVSSDNSTNFAWKGVATMMRYKSIARPVTSTYSVNTTRDRVIFNSISLPWDGSVPLV